MLLSLAHDLGSGLRAAGKGSAEGYGTQHGDDGYAADDLVADRHAQARSTAAGTRPFASRTS